MSWKLFGLACLVFFAGFFHYFLISPIAVLNNDYQLNYDLNHLKLIDTGILTIDIFINNLVLGFSLAFIGYFTAGIYTAISLYWNGYLLGIIFKAGLTTLTMQEVWSSLYHAPIELFSLFVFSSFGFRGFLFLKRIFFYRDFEIFKLKSLRTLGWATLGLLIAAVIEAI